MTRHDLAITEDEYDLLQTQGLGSSAVPTLSYHGKTTWTWNDQLILSCGDRPPLKCVVSEKIQVRDKHCKNAAVAILQSLDNYRVQDEDIQLLVYKRGDEEHVTAVELLERAEVAGYKSDEELKILMGFWRTWNSKKRKADEETVHGEPAPPEARQKLDSPAGSGCSLHAQPEAGHD